MRFGLGATGETDMLGRPITNPGRGEDSAFGITPDAQIFQAVADESIAAQLVRTQRNMRYIWAASAFGIGAVLFGAAGFFLGRRR